MALSSRFVDAIWARMLVRYGVSWLRKWEGIPDDAVKADWARELDGASGEAIAYALDHLPPDAPPNVLQFKALARCKPEPMPLALPAPKVDDAIVKRVMSGAKRIGRANPLDMFRDLKRREEAGERLTQAQRAMWRAALERKGASDEQS
jgi:hypothetical protein